MMIEVFGCPDLIVGCPGCMWGHCIPELCAQCFLYRSVDSVRESLALQKPNTTAVPVEGGSVSSAPHTPCQFPNEAGGKALSEYVTPATLHTTRNTQAVKKTALD